MIYYITNNKQLFENDSYKCISVNESIEILREINIISLDTETTGLDVFKGKLLLLQLGNKSNQIVIDCTTIDINLYKEILESNKLFIIHNAKFDLRWLYKEHIVLKNVYDTYLAEKILYLGYPPGIISLSLQGCCDRYLKIYLDKSVRGKIHAGITDDVINYAANDVVYLEDIMNFQLQIIRQRKQQVSLDIENQFVKVLAYIEFCGIKLDKIKWLNKMKDDLNRLIEAESKVNEWLLNYVKDNPKHMLNNYLPNKKTSKSQAVKFPKGIYVISEPPTLFDEFKNEPKCIINWSSSQQVTDIFETLGFNCWSKDKKTGKLKKSVDSKLIKQQKSKSGLAPLYLEYSAAFKVVTSFGQNFIDAINPITGRIHPTFSQLMDTGRLSCGSGGKKGSGKNKDDDINNDDNSISNLIEDNKSVNIQQLPSDEITRACFIPEEGNLLIDCDYGDLRMWIILSNFAVI